MDAQKLRDAVMERLKWLELNERRFSEMHIGGARESLMFVLREMYEIGRQAVTPPTPAPPPFCGLLECGLSAAGVKKLRELIALRVKRVTEDKIISDSYFAGMTDACEEIVSDLDSLLNGRCLGLEQKQGERAAAERLTGIKLEDIRLDQSLLVRTLNTVYEIEKRIGFDDFWIRGHPSYCKDWTRCRIHGSTRGGSVIRVGYIGLGMHLEFSLENHPLTITTSIIQEIWLV